ncbi:MAG: hypothetical protein HFG63_11170, partial [Lachnospiraceae bacterium]|nr:hypothetical protein [Lachnospiraceae bacterium]
MKAVKRLFLCLLLFLFLAALFKTHADPGAVPTMLVGIPDAITSAKSGLPWISRAPGQSGTSPGSGEPSGAGASGSQGTDGQKDTADAPKKYIKWVDFQVTSDAMAQALRYDVETCGQEPHFSWIELLAWLGAKYGGDFSRYKQSDLKNLVEKLKSGTTMAELTADSKYYSYYLEAYTAVLGKSFFGLRGRGGNRRLLGAEVFVVRKG